ncbi:hypothetical protein [Saccharococcus caldoxylosilyticus]|uniref:Uncharacterized protein n=1 Tax=Parageobacillus caldoxylosilyticus NBRC 107762 TaxID=1220594 RepID=A0A023DH26_9BACL|nr:hypothetical protein [Parageobacillus caldoxylosilyticus]MBB3853518.1 hypothetical protein [Parageobacillus caldoxylosilyticus]GAJ40306.1 hypothetical protein GCA01S_037_00150 [Parageobacillus caldoxylosilyticus NBRC 107762]
MLKKLAASLGAFVMAFGVFFTSQAHAVANFGPASWRTEDGKYELTVNATSTERAIAIYVYDVWYVNYNNNYAKRPADLSGLSVRLCSASTGNCTAFKKFGQYYVNGYEGSVIFYNMIPETYYVDIVDSWPAYYFKGKISASRSEW